KTGAHHHGPLESVIYVVKGKARMRWGEKLEFVAEAGPGDFIYVPPFVPHQEINASRDEVLECVLVRSDGEAVVVNLDIEPVEKPESVLWIDPIHRPPAEEGGSRSKRLKGSARGDRRDQPRMTPGEVLRRSLLPGAAVELLGKLATFRREGVHRLEKAVATPLVGARQIAWGRRRQAIIEFGRRERRKIISAAREINIA